MEAGQVQQVIAKDGEVLITGLPHKRGQAHWSRLMNMMAEIKHSRSQADAQRPRG
jgi:hypothetical protein